MKKKKHYTYEPIAAALLSLVPGLGHIYLRKVGTAFIAFIVCSIFYNILFLAGFIIHIIIIVYAWKDAKRINLEQGDKQ